ncbi:hypothetical protein GCM10027268_14400 [Brachybacterium huguangmaarense]
MENCNMWRKLAKGVEIWAAVWVNAARGGIRVCRVPCAVGGANSVRAVPHGPFRARYDAQPVSREHRVNVHG